MLSILGYFHPCENSHPSRVINNRQYFDEINIESFDFTNGFNCGNVHDFKKLNDLFFIIIELNFYPDQNNWKHNLIPIEFRKNVEWDRVVEFLIYKNHNALIQNLKVFLGNHDKNFICRRCFNSNTSEEMLMIHKAKIKNYDVTTIRISSESHLQWKYFFIRIFYILGFRQILKLRMKMVILVQVIKQLIFISKFGA